jgi:translation elongation factor EF-1alpha
MNLSSILRGKVKATALDSHYSENLGTVITCEITSGVIKVGDSLMIHQSGVSSEIFKISGIEMDGKIWSEAYASESVGLLIRNHDLSYFLSGATIESL